MIPPERTGHPAVRCRHAQAGRQVRHALQFGVSLLAIAAAIAAPARAQTVVGPGQTVTNSTSTTGSYSLTGDGGTLVNLGTIAPPSAVAVNAQVTPFSTADLSSYPISDVTLDNSGLISATTFNAVVGIGVDGFTITNSGSMTNSGAEFPTLYMNNVNNLQLNNTGTIGVNSGSVGARVADLYALTNSTLVNQGMLSIASTTDTSPVLFISGQSSNVTISNTQTISTVGSGQAILVGGTNLNPFTSTIDSTNVVTLEPVATNVTLNNSGMLSSNGTALTVGGFSSGMMVTNSGTISTGAASGANAIEITNAASLVSIANAGLIVNLGTGSAIDVATTGSGVSISNTGTIAEITGTRIAIDHINGTAPLAISTSGLINGGIRLSQPGDTLMITGGAINGAVTASNPGAGTVTFNAPGGFNTGGDYGSTSAPLGAVVIAGGTLDVNNVVVANTIALAPTAANVSLNNIGELLSTTVGLAIGGTDSAIGVINSGTIGMGSASGANAISIANAASGVSIANSGYVVNAGTGAAIDVSTSGTSVSIGNIGTIAELAGTGIAIDHINGTAPLAISNSGIIEGGIRLQEAADSLSITGGGITGAVTATTPGAGTVTFNVPGGFTTSADYGSASDPIGAIVLAGGTLSNANTLTANAISVAPTAANVTLNNAGVLVAGNTALTIGGSASAIGVSNGGTITTSAGGANAIAIAGGASGVSIANVGLVMNAGAGAAIDVSSSGSNVTIGNTGTITEAGGTGFAIDHLNGTAPLAINTSGAVNGGIRLSQPGDALNITGGTISGAVVASNPGAGTVTFNAPAGFTTGSDFGSAASPLGSIVIAGGTLNNNNTLTANAITVAPTAANVYLYNAGTLSASNTALGVGGTAADVSVINASTITTTSASGTNAIAVSGAASQVLIETDRLVSNAGTGSAIDVSTTGAGVTIDNVGTITEVAGNGIAIDHANGTQPLAISNVGVINGNVRLSQPGDTLNIGFGTINGAVIATTPGAGIVTLATPTGFTTTNDFGSASSPLGAIIIEGTLNSANTLAANSIVLSGTPDVLNITGGAVDGAVTAATPGAGSVTFDVPGGFTTGSSFGSAASPLGAIVIGGGGLNNSGTLVANSISLASGATNTTLDNTGVLSSPTLALTLGGASSVIGVINSGAITTTSASGTNAISVSGAASGVSIANSGLVSNAGTGSAIDVSTTGSGVGISNTGTITELGGNGIAIDHANGTQPLAISNSGIINGAVRLSLAGDTLAITGGAVNGAIIATNPGAGTITFNAPGGFTTGGDIGTTTSPIGAIVIAGGTLNNANLVTANSITVASSATSVTLNNSGLLSSANLGLAIGGSASGVAVVNSGAILTSAAGGSNAIAISGAANNVGIGNIGLVENVGSGSAIEVSTSGGGVVIGNTGTISELGGNGIAIDHAGGLNGGGQPLTINTSGIVNGGIRLTLPGDALNISGGAVTGAVIAGTPGAGTVTFSAPGGFTTSADFGTAASPLGAITVAGGVLNLNNALWANSVTFGPGSTTTLGATVNAVASGGNLNFAGGALSLGTNALVVGSNATIRTSTVDGSSIYLTIGSSTNGLINARAGNATVDTSANTMVIRPNLVGALPTMGAQYAVIETSSGATVANALTKMSVAPGPTAALFTIGTATSTTDAYGNPLTPGKDIVLTVTGSTGAMVNAAVASSNQPIQREEVNAVVTGITQRIGDAVSAAIAASIGNTPIPTPQTGLSGGDEAQGHDFTVWVDTSGNYLQDTSTSSAYSGSIWTGLAGVDTPLTDSLIAGVVLGGEGESFKLSTANGRRSGTGISITPYAAYILSDWASVDVELSYARLDNRVWMAALSLPSDHYATNRVFAAGNFSAYWKWNDLTLRGKIGYLIANTGGPAYTDNMGVNATPQSTSLQEAKLGGEATYNFDQFQPFLDMTLADDVKGAGGLNSATTGVTSTSRYGLQYDAGLRYKTEGGISMGFQLGGETLRGTQSSYTAGVFARIPL